MYFKEPLVISFDIDGVIVDNFPFWKAIYNAKALEHKHSPQIIPYSKSPIWDYFKNICKECWDYCLHNKDLIINYPARCEAYDSIKWLHSLGAKIHLVTARPQDVAATTQVWASQVFEDSIVETHVTNNKVEILREIGSKYHLEDSPAQLKAIQSLDSVVSITYDYPYNQMIDGPRVDNFEQFLILLLHRESK